ncbi:transcriptional regulator, XRE family with cupin sensor [Ruegeria halocynthiae]|uniref:Transcriptional regulator, XRE family with cupin sensor n=2 Tax=Ruegeria halocynthiae TaxID=985054 RepID=A0A1H2YII7_9RHOB|nr:transcriptional regulator, XRE family with cupin sensor [Ruegeria halocynthiae]
MNDSLPTDDGEFGKKIRNRRQIKTLSLQELASKSGVSIAQISNIERNVSKPTVRTLRAICEALEFPMNWLASDSFKSDHPFIVRREKRREVEFGENKSQRVAIRKEFLSPDSCNGIQLLQLTVTPKASTGRRSFETPGQARSMLVLEGELHMELDNERLVLRAGDTCSFNQSLPIRYWNDGNADCRIILAITPAVY